ncbi:RHS repeat-associated core domain-containing protein, partial [Porphyromonas macacae]
AREGDSSFIPFLFQGQYFDEETDLCYNRFRYYSPDTGSYISQDPIGLAGGNPTLYAYVKDSNDWIDVFGLDCQTVFNPKNNRFQDAKTGKFVSRKNIKDKITVYRVFGGDARAAGYSWSPVNPTTVDNYRYLAGLPSGGASVAINTADFMLKGQVNIGDIIKIREALPLDGNIGGLTEFIIDPKNVTITDILILNP